MKLFISLLLAASLANFVSALPFSGQSSESDIAEREDTQLLPRNKLFAEHGTYSKQKAVEFVKNIPLSSLRGLGEDVKTLHSVDRSGRVAKKNEKPSDGFRLDNQGKTSEGHHNLQVQINGPRNGKSTIGGIIVKDGMGAKAIRKHLVHAVMHPNKDKHGNEYLHKHVHNGEAPTHPDGRRKTNAEARKRTARHGKPSKVNPKSKKHRKAARKASFK
jgi:hypothetical protein